MRIKVSIALIAVVLSPLYVGNLILAAQKSMDEPTVIAGAERDRSYPGWEGFQPFEVKPKEGGTGQQEMGQQPQGQQGQPEEMIQRPQSEGQPSQPQMEQHQPEGKQGVGSPGGNAGGGGGSEGGQQQ
jgi:hypothetical protein